MDPRDKKLAKLLVNYSCDIQKDEKNIDRLRGGGM